MSMQPYLRLGTKEVIVATETEVTNQNTKKPQMKLFSLRWTPLGKKEFAQTRPAKILTSTQLGCRRSLSADVTAPRTRATSALFPCSSKYEMASPPPPMSSSAKRWRAWCSGPPDLAFCLTRACGVVPSLGSKWTFAPPSMRQLRIRRESSSLSDGKSPSANKPVQIRSGVSSAPAIANGLLASAAGWSRSRRRKYAPFPKRLSKK